MPPPFIQPSWPPLVVGDRICTFSHLDEFCFQMQDSAGRQRWLLVSFSDHVFTREDAPPTSAPVLFPGCSRDPGYFCDERYAFSLGLRSRIEGLPEAQVWLLSGQDRFALIPQLDRDGRVTLFAVVFTLGKVSGLPADLHLRIRSAYPFDRRVPDTFGQVRFRHLVKLRCEGRHPPKRHDRGRLRPKIRP